MGGATGPWGRVYVLISSRAPITLRRTCIFEGSRLVHGLAIFLEFQSAATFVVQGPGGEVSRISVIPFSQRVMGALHLETAEWIRRLTMKKCA